MKRNEDQTTDTIHHQHDTAYKFLLSSKKLFAELLRSFINRNWAYDIKEEHVEQIPHSFVLQDFKKQEADIIYRVDLDGQDVLFYILVELQSTVDYRMPYRLLQYQLEIWRYWLDGKKHRMKNRKSFYLPPIIPIVLYNGKNNWTAKREFRHLLQNEIKFGTELLNFEYVLIDIARYTEAELLSISNTLSTVFLLDQIQDQEQLQERLSKLLQTIRQLPEEGQQKLVAWITHILRQQLPVNEPGIEQLLNNAKGAKLIMGLEKVLAEIKDSGIQTGIQAGIQTGIQRGIQIGEERGIQQAQQQIAKQMLAKQIDIALIAEVTGLSLEKIKKLHN